MSRKPKTAPSATSDVVVRPSHYIRWAIQPLTFIQRNKMEFWRGNILKYACRAGSKLYDGMDEVQSEITDLRKAIRYAEVRINELEGNLEL
jgi:uncharacterized protein DUF3310